MILVMALAGGVGASARFVLDGWIRSRWPTVMPWGTWVVNLLGSLALGLVTGSVLSGADPSWHLVGGTGFLGGFTTFSTASVETVRLWGKGRAVLGFLNLVGMALACVAAAGMGLALTA